MKGFWKALALSLLASTSVFAAEKDAANVYSESIVNLPDIVPSQVIELKDGETFKLVAKMVKQKVGKTYIKRLAYNGQIPGPAIKVTKGTKIKIDFKNESDAPTTVHSHGIRLDYRFDGVAGVGGQKAIGPGESFTYEIVFPDVGIYWYHPHLREDYGQDHGLYGNFLVTPTEKDYYNTVNSEELLVVDDVLLGKQAAAYPKDVANFALMGRYGNTMLINGKPNYIYETKKNAVTRFFITNVANTRTFHLAFKNAKMKVVGSDGGRYEHEKFVDALVISPSERYVVEVQFKKPGNFEIWNRTPRKSTKLGIVKVLKEAEKQDLSESHSKLRSRPEVISEIDPFRKDLTKAADKNLKVSVSMGGMSHADHMAMMAHGKSTEKIEWNDSMPEANQKSRSDQVTWKLIDTETKKENMDIHWVFPVGKTAMIRVFNDSNSMHPMQHPIHFHGQRFLIARTNGVPNQNLTWKDTALVQSGDTVDILMDNSNPGEWMGHCHIAEHQMSGMMMHFEVK